MWKKSMDKREELHNKYLQDRNFLENRLEELSYICNFTRRKWDEECDIQTSLRNVFDNIAMSDPDIEKSDAFMESYNLLRDRSNIILECREKEYYDIGKICSEMENELDNIQVQYYRSLDDEDI